MPWFVAHSPDPPEELTEEDFIEGEEYTVIPEKDVEIVPDEDFKLNLDRKPWVQYLPDFGRLPGGAQFAFAILMAVTVAVALGWCTPRIAHGSPGSCEFIKNADNRHFCRAVSIPRPSECEFIKAPDLRHLCRVRVR